MAAMISYSVAATPVDGSATSLTVAPPPAYAAGNFLVMGVIAGGTSAAVTATAPSGWTTLPGSGTPGLFYKTATSSEPSSYTIALGGTSCAAAFVAAYPAATGVTSAFHASAADVVSYSPAFPTGVTAGQTVLLVAAAVASASDANGNNGYQNVMLPAGPGWTTEVPVFGPALPDNTAALLPCAVGLADITGSASTPVLASPQGCVIYAGYVVATLAASSPLAVTATVQYPEGTPGLALTVKALSGAAPAAAIAAGGAAVAFYANGTSQAPQAAITPAATGSLVYGAVSQNFSVTSGTAFTANAGTTFTQNIADTANVAIYGTFRGTSPTTAATPVTLGGSAPVNAFTSAALAEILKASGGTLAETATATASGTLPGNFATTAVAQAAVFPVAPAAGSLLVAMVSANSLFRDGNASVTITDSSGLTWIPLAQRPYPAYSGVWIAQVGAAPASYVIEDESAAAVDDEAGHQVYDESGPGSSAPFTQPHRATAGKARARKGTTGGSPGAKYVFVPVVPSVFAQPHKAVTGRASARKGSAVIGPPGAAYVFVPVIPAPFAQPSRAIAGKASAASGAAAGSPGAQYAFVPPSETFVILDEAGSAVLDESGAEVYDESGPGPIPGSPVWSAARAGLVGDESAVNWAAQVSQFLSTHAITPVYSGNRVWTVATPAAPITTAFSWLDSTTPGWLPLADVSLPFPMPAGVTTVGRVQVPVQASGNGADLQVTLCPDNGSGFPLLSSPLASVVIPAAHIAALSATASLQTAAPLATSRYNTSYAGARSVTPWTQPAVSANGAGSFATPATSGNYTALIGGFDSVASVATAGVYVLAANGAAVSTGASMPALPQAAWYTAAVITADSVVVAGGRNGAGVLASAWTASWDPGTGTVGAWSAQQALPGPLMYAGMASWGTTVYVIGGSSTGLAAAATGFVQTASASGGQVSAWTAGAALPVKLMQPYAAVVGNWLVVTGGVNASGTPQSATWFSAVNSDGSLAGWQPGPALPVATYALGPGWNTAVTDSAMLIVSGTVTGSASPYTQVLSVSPDGPADMWQLQDWGFGEFQAAAYPAAGPGQWQLFQLSVNDYVTGTVHPVPLLSVPLPATGLTPGAAYHVVFHQSGGSETDSLQLGAMVSGPETGYEYAPHNSGEAWAPVDNVQVALNVFDQTPGGQVLHLVQDSGAGVTTLAWQGAAGLLSGVLESAVFPPGSPQATLPSVVQVTYAAGSVPAGITQLT